MITFVINTFPNLILFIVPYDSLYHIINESLNGFVVFSLFSLLLVSNIHSTVNAPVESLVIRLVVIGNLKWIQSENFQYLY